MQFGNTFTDWIKRTDTNENSDDSMSISSECAIIDDSILKSTEHDHSTSAEGRIHDNVVAVNKPPWVKLKECLVLFWERICERVLEFYERAKEVARNSNAMEVIRNSKAIEVIRIFYSHAMKVIRNAMEGIRNSKAMKFVRNNIWLVVGVAAVVLILFCLLIAGVSIGLGNSKIQDDSPGDGFDFTGIDVTDTPTTIITKEPTKSPTIAPTTEPSSAPTTTYAPSHSPSDLPSAAPTFSPTALPSASPTTTPLPTELPSFTPTYTPTQAIDPVARPPILPFNEDADSILTFCVVADAPYTEVELAELPDQIATQTDGCEFLIHLGDIFVGDTPCLADDYETMRDIMLESNAPAFMVPGDNEWNDCIRAEIDSGWGHWTNQFLGFEDNWNHTFSIARQPGYPENFYFIEKRTLLFGLNIVGGRVHNTTEWKTRLRSEYKWVRDVMTLNLVNMKTADGVILMAHAHPSENHREFFNAFRVFLRDELKNEFPVMYLHGDGHNFLYTPNYHNQSNFLRVQHEGGTNEPVLKIMAGPGRGPGGRSSVHNAFQYDRQLNVFPSRLKQNNKQ